MEISKLIKRHYTKELEGSAKSVFDLFKWKNVDVVLKNHSTGKVITYMKDLEFPEDYSQTACDIIASKYFRKKGVPNERGYEYSMKQIAHRMVDFWANSLVDEKIIAPSEKAIVYDELCYMLLSQKWAPNSPQWFNTGLWHSYGISGHAQGHYYFDEQMGCVVASDDAFKRTQGSACFIISVEDSLIGNKSLTDQLTTETLLFKYGSGVGTNWSPIRGVNEPLAGGGKSSGLLSFLKVSDRNAGAIKSGGTTRRAAKMNVLNLDHPEIMEYIMWKSSEEDKAAALGKMGYSTGFEGEAYETISGQNANNSVRIANDFMEKIHDDSATYKLKGRMDSSADKEIPVRDIWEKTAYAAWRCGDPGVQFDDNINSWHTCPAGEDSAYFAPHNRINASNPCSEYMFLDDTACNLASINILNYYDGERGVFDTDGYLHSIFMIQLALEATIHWGQFPTMDIARRSYLFRTTGIGLTNLGALFMNMALPYDSDEARNLAAALSGIMTGYSYYASSLMADAAGPFTHYEKNALHMKKVIRNHARAAAYDPRDIKFEDMPVEPARISHDILGKIGFPSLADALKTTWQLAIENGEKYGYRNAQVSVLAPTGTISFAMDCATTSSEPFFSHIAFKKLVGGGAMEIVNPLIGAALEKLGYNDDDAIEIIEYIMRKEEKNGYSMLVDGKIEGAPHLKAEHYSVFDTANTCGSGKRYISPMGHVKMVAAITPHVTGAISKTVNLPNSATVKDIKDIYEAAWKYGIKSIAVYRDGCKASQPLNTSKAAEGSAKSIEDYTYAELLDYAKSRKHSEAPLRVKPHGIRAAHVHEANINGLKLYITTSFYEDGRLGEVYVSSGKQGSLTKGLLDSLSTTISKMLQYGVPPEDIASMYRGQKYEPSGFISGHPYIKQVDSISDLISKIIDIELGNYKYCQVKPESWEDKNSAEFGTGTAYHLVKDSEIIHGEVCPNCKSERLVKNGTCKVCMECGTTTGCS